MFSFHVFAFVMQMMQSKFRVIFHEKMSSLDTVRDALLIARCEKIIDDVDFACQGRFTRITNFTALKLTLGMIRNAELIWDLANKTLTCCVRICKFLMK